MDNKIIQQLSQQIKQARTSDKPEWIIREWLIKECGELIADKLLRN